jgi:predicted O-linked N-acetylglucosamine transferase (SPINDLY family)
VGAHPRRAAGFSAAVERQRARRAGTAGIRARNPGGAWHPAGTDRPAWPHTPRAEHLATFGEIDIALDPFPQNGGASTWEALWQGVPVVAKLGNSAPGRLSGAILSAVGLSDWIVEDDDYVALAVTRASDLAALAALRRELRAIVSASPAGNPVLYTRAVEEAYRTMWRRWCAATQGRSKA